MHSNEQAKTKTGTEGISASTSSLSQPTRPFTVQEKNSTTAPVQRSVIQMQSELDELPEDVRQEIFKHLTNPVDRLSMAQVNRKGLKSIKFLEKLDPQLTHMMNLKRIGERQRGLAGRPQSNLRFENSIQYQSEEGS